LSLSQTLQEDREVVFIAQFLELDPPLDLADGSVEADDDREIAAVVVELEDGSRIVPG
jgi:hypothetical protein